MRNPVAGEHATFGAVMMPALCSGDLENAEVLTFAYLDENGELVCEEAVDSDDDFDLHHDEDPDAQVCAIGCCVSHYWREFAGVGLP